MTFISCKECSHYEVCPNNTSYEFALDVRGYCDNFKQGWISVENRLPEPFVSVLGYMTDAGDFPPVRECYTVGGKAFYFPALKDMHPVSHWMPMPEPPKENDYD